MFGKTYNKEQIEELNKQLEDLSVQKSMLEAKLDESLDTIQDLASKEQTFKEQLVSHNAKLASINAIHTAELTALEQSVNKRVNSHLASIGVTTFAAETFTVNLKQSDTEAYTTFMSLTGNEQTEYYKKYKDKIMRVQLK